MTTISERAEAETGVRDLPDGWSWVKFGKVVRNVDVSVRNPLEQGIERYLGLEHIDPESLHIKRWGLIADGITFTRKFRPGQVLFGKRRAYQRKVAVAEFEGICSGDILVFEPANDSLIPELLPFIVQSEGFFQHALGTSAGSLSPRTRWRDLADYEFALPPPDEQRRIVEILWAAEAEKRQLSRVANAISALGSAVYRDVFEDEAHEQIMLSKFVSNGTISFQTGPFGTVLQASSYVDRGTPVVNPVNMVDGKLWVEEGPFLNADECERLARYKMRAGDILLGRKGDMGRAVYVSAEYEGWIVGSDCIRIRVTGEDLDSLYLYHFLRAPQTNAWLSRHASGTTMPGMSERTLARLEIPIPDHSHQVQFTHAFDMLETARASARVRQESINRLISSLLHQLLNSEQVAQLSLTTFAEK